MLLGLLLPCYLELVLPPEGAAPGELLGLLLPCSQLELVLPPKGAAPRELLGHLLPHLLHLEGDEDLPGLDDLLGLYEVSVDFAEDIFLRFFV
jgi:hypothetical protein